MAQYSAERKESVVRKLLADPDRSIRELSEETGVSTWTLYDWRRQMIGKGEAMGSRSHPGKASGRQRSAGAKLAAVVETQAMNEAELAEYCRGKGLYPEEVKAWRTPAEAALGGGLVPQKQLREAVAAEKKRAKELERELHRKEKALAETAALLTLRKKAAAIVCPEPGRRLSRGAVPKMEVGLPASVCRDRRQTARCRFAQKARW